MFPAVHPQLLRCPQLPPKGQCERDVSLLPTRAPVLTAAGKGAKAETGLISLVPYLCADISPAGLNSSSPTRSRGVLFSAL